MLRVAAAYDLSRGNPLKHWNRLDFVFGKGGNLTVRAAGLRARLEKENEAILTVENEAFSFSVDGFDIYRDLYVRVDDLSENATQKVNGEAKP
jgi:hypothetical protein